MWEAILKLEECRNYFEKRTNLNLCKIALARNCEAEFLCPHVLYATSSAALRKRDISIKPQSFSGDDCMVIKVKARYEDKVLKPLEKLDLKEGEEVELELKKSVTDRTFGILSLNHEEIEGIIEDTEYGSW
jgi:predicted DNA-binding antitoxin AbrB/MazE fold protein